MFLAPDVYLQIEFSCGEPLGNDLCGKASGCIVWQVNGRGRGERPLFFCLTWLAGASLSWCMLLPPLGYFTTIFETKITAIASVCQCGGSHEACAFGFAQRKIEEAEVGGEVVGLLFV